MHIGERIAAYRKRRGMSQDALAGLIGMSRSWLSQVERGIHSVDRLSTLADLASVLRVDVADLIGREWRLAPNGAPHVQALGAIGRQLAGYSHLLGEQLRPWPLPQLRNAAVEIHRAYQAAHYDKAAAALPQILAAADAYDGYNGKDGRETHLARCTVYAVTAKLLTKVGEGHLAWLAADRATHAALAADSISAQGLAAYQVVCALLEIEQVDQAERVAIHSAERLMPHAASDAPHSTSLAGALWLIGSVIAARKSDRPTALARLDTAGRLSGLVGHDANHAWTAFGPTNVQIHRASCYAELGDPHGVLMTATEINVDAMPKGLMGRRSRMHLDLAWAHTQARNDVEALLHLHQADASRG
jgi:transcriptional regulator with XRE-family HTH domain